MPQATEELRAQWPGGDTEAWAHLAKSGFIDDEGLIKAPSGYEPTERDYSAIDYLCQEWDYAWHGVEDSSNA